MCGVSWRLLGATYIFPFKPPTGDKQQAAAAYRDHQAIGRGCRLNLH